MSIADAIREMLDKGLSIEQALMAAEVIESHEVSQLDARRANDRARKARHREKRSRDGTGGHVTERDVSRDGTEQKPSRARPFFMGEELKKVKKPDTNVSVKESEKSEKRHVTSPKLGKRLSDEWTPSESLCAFAEDLGVAGHSLEEAVAEFRDYWRGVPGQRGTKLDWDATFRNRLREKAARKKGSQHGKGSLVDAGRDLVRRLGEARTDVRPADGGGSSDAPFRLLPRLGGERS